MALRALVRCGAALLALVGAAGAADARYADYTGVRMPAYGGEYVEPREPGLEPDDYRGHSPDAPAALDYKDDDDFKGKSEPSGAITRDANSWQTVPRKAKKTKKVEEDHQIDEAEFDLVDDFPKLKSNNRLTKHRSRLKSRKFDNNDDESSRYLLRHSRDQRGQDEVFGNIEAFSMNKEDVRDSIKNYDSDKRHDYRATSERVPRRKPRDRYVKRDLEESEEKIESEVDRELEAWHAREVTADMFLTGRPPTGPGAVDERLGMMRPRAKPGRRGDDYGDYYDMKRVLNMKNRLTSQPRRTQAWDVADPFGRRQFTERISGFAPGPLSTDRRSPIGSRGTRTTYSDDEASISAFPDITRKIVTEETQEVSSTTTTSTSSTSTSTDASLPDITVKNILKELSLAEKSRLSILKKAQRKEGSRHEVSTKKPPVLLQVKEKLATMVMVEPPSSVEPWMRAREIVADSPARLEKVKRLMRHKLVANARNIHDLTDNWDDLVCDYIDMSLIDNSAQALRPLLMAVIHIPIFSCFIVG